MNVSFESRLARGSTSGNTNNGTEKTQPYEFEKVRDFMSCQPHDTEEDKAHQDMFRPKRQYLGMTQGQQFRRCTMPTTAVERLRSGMASQLKQARHCFQAHQKPSVGQTLTAFEWKRRKQEMEEGSLYRATRRLRNKRVAVGPEDLVKDDEEVDLLNLQRSNSLMALLERDANKHNASLPNISFSSDDDLTATTEGSESSTDDKKARKDHSQQKETVVKQKIEKRRQLHSQKPDASSKKKKKKEQKRRKSQTTEKKAEHIEASRKVVLSPFAESSGTPVGNDGVRQEQMRMLKVALKSKAASQPEPPLMSLVSIEATKQQTAAEAKRRSKRANRRFSAPSNEGGASTLDHAAPKPVKEDRRAYMQRRSSAPNFASTVAALTSHGSTPEEALKEMSAMPSHMLAGIITAPLREKAEEQKPVLSEERKETAASSSHRSSMPGQHSSNVSAKELNDSKPSKASRGSRRSSAPAGKEASRHSGKIYDWALAAKTAKKQREMRNTAAKKSSFKAMSPVEAEKGSVKLVDSARLPKMEPMTPLMKSTLREELAL